MLVWRLCSYWCFGIIISDLFFYLPAVCLAAEAGSVGCLEVLIDQAMMDPTVGDEAGMTPLHFAAEAGTPTSSFQIGSFCSNIYWKSMKRGFKNVVRVIHSEN